MAAFDVSALAPPTSASSRAPRASSNLSARAQVTLAAMDSEGGLNDSPYGAASSGSRPRLGRRASESSITMGFPSGAGSKGKGQQLIEIYGVRCVLLLLFLREGRSCQRLIPGVWVSLGKARRGRISGRGTRPTTGAASRLRGRAFFPRA